jgi:hypothetical protein
MFLVLYYETTYEPLIKICQNLFKYYLCYNMYETYSYPLFLSTYCSNSNMFQYDFCCSDSEDSLYGGTKALSILYRLQKPIKNYNYNS